MFRADRLTMPSCMSVLNARPIAVSLVTFFAPAAGGRDELGFGGKELYYYAIASPKLRGVTTGI